MIGSELAAFLESGITILVGTRDARLRPECVRCVGCRVEGGGAELVVFMPEATGARAVGDLGDNRRIAVFWSRVADHRSVQVKGRVASVERAAERDRAHVARYLEAFERQLQPIGVPPRWIRRMQAWPCHAVRLRVESVFEQTPGPGAGLPLGAAAPGPGARA